MSLGYVILSKVVPCPFSSCYSLMGNIPLNVICHFPLVVVFNILSLSLIFISLITMCFNVFLLGLSILGSLCFLDLVDYFLSHVREVFSYYLFNIFSGPLLLSSSSGTPIMQMLVRLILSQRSLSLSSFFFHSFFYILFCSSDFHHSVFQVGLSQWLRL